MRLKLDQFNRGIYFNGVGTVLFDAAMYYRARYEAGVNHSSIEMYLKIIRR